MVCGALAQFHMDVGRVVSRQLIRGPLQYTAPNANARAISGRRTLGTNTPVTHGHLLSYNSQDQQICHFDATNTTSVRYLSCLRIHSYTIEKSLPLFSSFASTEA